LKQVQITAARAGTPNATESLWLHLEIHHSNCRTGIPGTAHREKENAENTTALGILFPFFHAGGDEECPGCAT